MTISENLYLNFHAHRQEPAHDEIVIQSLFLQDNLIASKSDKIFFTAGLHPWNADRLTYDLIRHKLEQLINSGSIIAVGETGLDKVKGPNLNIQTEVFRIHVEIAEKYNIPVIVHSVKSHNEILKLKIDLASKVPWVIHHFNGSEQIAMDFINHGFYLSFSYHINNENSRLGKYLNNLPIEKIFLETDDFDVDIKDLYDVTARKYGITIEALKIQLINNLNNLLNE